jgi:hypothetical protein
MKSGHNLSSSSNQENIKIIKNGKDNLYITFHIENRDINLLEFINFNLFDILFKINKDVCESYRLDVRNEGEARLQLVLKHILKDLGVPRMWANVIIVRENLRDKVVFTVTNVPLTETIVSEEYELVPVKNITIYCNISNPHKIDIIIDVLCEDEDVVDSDDELLGDEDDEGEANRGMRKFLDKMTNTLLKNIINRLKQFMEKMTYTSNQHLC